MTHTDEEIKAAEQRLAERLDAGDTFTMHDVSELRAVADAAQAVAAAEALLRERVQIARAHGHSWNRIAIPLGVSRQAARQRFADDATPSGEPAASASDDLMVALENALIALRENGEQLHTLHQPHGTIRVRT